MKKADLRKKSAQKETNYQDDSSSKHSRDSFERRSPIDKFAGKVKVEPSNDEGNSDSDSQLKKRRPRRPGKPVFKLHPSIREQKIKLDQVGDQSKHILSKSQEIESRLKRLLLEIKEMPADVDSHLELVVEELDDIGSEMEVFEQDKDQVILYNSQIGKYLVVIRKIVLDTYPQNPRSFEVENLTRKLLEKATEFIAKAVCIDH